MTTTPVPRIITGDPAAVFLSRASELSRLQQRIIAMIQTEIAVESEEHSRSFESVAAQPSPESMSSYVQQVLSNLETSRLRWRDIQVMFQLFFCRHIEDFETFLQHLLRDIATFEPSVLADVPIKKTAQKLPPAERFQRQLRKLSYMSIREITDAVDPHFELFPSPSTRMGIQQSYELRNLYVHNYGIADAHFLARFKDSRFVEGQPVELDPNFIAAAMSGLIESCRDIRNRASPQFRLKWRAIPTPS
jgi:hypothetical protein